MKKLLLLLFAFPLLFISCGKEGAQGPIGETGYTDVFAFEYEVLPNAWNESGLFGDPDYGFVAFADFPELTSSVLNNGIVVGYYIQPDNGQIPMPAIFYNNGFSTNYDYILYQGEIEFYKRESDNQTEIPTVPLYYKMVVIDGTFKTLPDLSEMSLSEVEAYFNITEYKKVEVQ